MKQCLMIACCIVLLLTGCTHNNTASGTGKLTGLRQTEMNILKDRMNDKASFTTAPSSEDFHVRSEADLYIEDNTPRIVYNVTVDEPTIHMNNVVISFILEDQMKSKLVSNDVFFTTLNGNDTHAH
ncbi:hypothetical protein [Paenibacillus tengchongensis]|uniref:hypothetical protein n=1 Tax=Paenibacillus tengchongensis TaxID=2608684 RepID=UPI00124EB2E5|nr:hypothetical protein [Paenibacillus tengchongensis]